MAEAGVPESVAARCLDESSDSEPEQEPGTPQKLIRKVSTSGQIRSKVGSLQSPGLDRVCGQCFHSAGWATRRKVDPRRSVLRGRQTASANGRAVVSMQMKFL